MKKQIETHTIECKMCGVDKVAPINITGWTCSDCVRELWDPADAPKAKKPTGYPPGWKFMKEFVHENGTVYHKGEEQPDLQGTLPSTPIKIKQKDPRSKAQKARDKQDLLVKINTLRKEVKRESRTTYRRKLETQLKKLEKQL
jgi:hypothetical protein